MTTKNPFWWLLIAFIILCFCIATWKEAIMVSFGLLLSSGFIFLILKSEGEI